MTLFQTIKRRAVRARKRVNQFIGYSNHGEPALTVSLDAGYSLEITFADLAYLVRRADEFAAKGNYHESIKNWRELQ